jgi:PAS domain S-box-containing protein
MPKQTTKSPNSQPTVLGSEDSFRLLVESLKDYAIVMLVPGGHVASWNAGAERFKGCRPEEIIGKHFSCFYPPEAIERGLPQRELETAAKDGRFEDEGWRVRKDGKKFRANVIISALREKDGTLRGFSKVTRDLTERKQAEEVLRESEARYRTLVENIPQKIFMKDRNGRWISVNDNFARDFGIRPEDIVGKVNADLFSKEIADKCTADEERVMETGQAAELDERYVQSARETWVHTTKTPVRDKNGGIIGLFGIFWYITERKQAQETIHQLNSELERRVLDRTSQLEAANQELEAFSYSVSHDLRAPLRAVDGFSKIVLEDYGPQLPEGCRQDLQTIRSGAQKMGKLIDELLTFSRLSRLPLSKQAVDTGMMVRGVLEELNSHRNGQRIEFRIADLPTCQADPALLKQV